MALSPMMREYQRCKDQYPDAFLFYRVGDFYEMFFDDALKASKELEITLTGKDCGLEERAPMCGVPFHAVDTYIDRLTRKGYKVAICEQVEDPKLAKGLVKREVIRVVTPGTNLSVDTLAEDRNRYIALAVMNGDRFGLAVSDITTGAFYVTELTSLRQLTDELMHYGPAELLTDDALTLSAFPFDLFRERMQTVTETLPARFFSEEAVRSILTEHFHVYGTEGLGLARGSLAETASGALLRYLHETQKNELSQITSIRVYAQDDAMVLDSATLRNLELTETIRDKRKNGSLLGVLDRTKTAMGARLLRAFTERPLTKKDAIEARLGAVGAFVDDPISLSEAREYLQPVYDLERLSGRIAARTAGPRDLRALSSSMALLPDIRRLLLSMDAPLLKQTGQDFDPLEDLAALIEASIVDEPPLAMKEGGIIRDGYSEEVDGYRAAKKEGTTWLAQMEEEERKKTGIHTLRIKYNRVFGYCIEVTNSFRDLVPDRYIRKQTLTGAERYTTPELRELEDKILGAQDKLYTLEYELFCNVRDTIGDAIGRIQKTAYAIALTDALASLAYVALHGKYTRPVIREDGRIRIKDGRHPVVEKMTGEAQFVPNDTVLNGGEDRIAVITGPNMAGKSTYMRQSALIVLMAQIGSFVPAASAEIGIVDRIFTRVGASDDLAAGQSTFMVEMTEVANILRNATSRSLLILDEIGRGTSTFDGLSIAWAVIEYIADRTKIGAKTLFATHYHELTELEGKIDGVKNYCIAVKESGEDIVFLRKIVRGGADRSYGIQAARLAGVPAPVLERAKELAAKLSDADITEKIRDEAASAPASRPAPQFGEQLSFFFTDPKQEEILSLLESCDPDRMTPIEALQFLAELKKKAGKS